MKRFMGMMPSSEIEVQKRYKDDDGCLVDIQAGPHGWTVTYADLATDYRDVDATTEENFNAAYNLAVEKLGTLIEEKEEIRCEVIEGEC